MGESVPRHCALDQEISQIHSSSATGVIRPAFLHDLGYVLFFRLLCPGVPWKFVFLFGHTFPRVFIVGSVTRLGGFWNHAPAPQDWRIR